MLDMGKISGVSITKLKLRSSASKQLKDYMMSITPIIVRIDGFTNLSLTFTSDTSCTILFIYNTVEHASKAEDEEIELLSARPVRDILVAPLSRDLKQDGGFISDNVSFKFIIQKYYRNNKRWVWSILFILFM